MKWQRTRKKYISNQVQVLFSAIILTKLCTFHFLLFKFEFSPQSCWCKSTHQCSNKCDKVLVTFFYRSLSFCVFFRFLHFSKFFFVTKKKKLDWRNCKWLQRLSFLTLYFWKFQKYEVVSVTTLNIKKVWWRYTTRNMNSFNYVWKFLKKVQ